MILPRLIQPVAVLQQLYFFVGAFCLNRQSCKSRLDVHVPITPKYHLHVSMSTTILCKIWKSMHPLKLKCKITDSYIVSFQATFKIFKLMSLDPSYYNLCMVNLIMPRCACASEVYGSVFVCVCVCLCRLLQLLKDQRSASKGFYRLLVMFSWILIRGFAK